MVGSMKAKPARNFAVARWILVVGLMLLLGVIALTTLADRKQERGDRTKTPASASSSESSPSTPSKQRVVGTDVPPWVAASQSEKLPLPEGVVPASEINPPPPDPNTPQPRPPIEPPNPATHRP